MRHLAVLLLLLPFTGSAQNRAAIGAQPTVRFDHPLSTWHVADTYLNNSQAEPNFIETSTKRYFFNGDSTVTGDTWRQMWSQPTTTLPPAPSFEGLSRQTGDLVLFMDPAGMLDTLYDFGIQVDDSVWYEIPGGGGDEFHLAVHSIDSLLIQGAYHKVFRFDTSEVYITPETFLSDRWIEGIGSVHGPLAPHYPQVLDEWFMAMDSTRTTCFAQGGPILWQHTSYTACSVNIILSVEDLAGIPLKTFPNPAADILFIAGLSPGTWEYQVIDALGRHKTIGTFTAQGEPSLDLSALPSGTYVLQVMNASGRIAQSRFIKT